VKEEAGQDRVAAPINKVTEKHKCAINTPALTTHKNNMDVALALSSKSQEVACGPPQAGIHREGNSEECSSASELQVFVFHL
jgi:hypothetical protein